MDLTDDLQTRMDRVNRLLTTQQSMPHKLEAIAEIIERTVDGADAVSIALVIQDTALTGATSSQLAIEADLVQYGYNEGPCLLAVDRRGPVRIELMAQDERFEHFAPGAIELGVESSLSVPLFWKGEVVGSINLYSRTPAAFDGEVESLGPVAEYAGQVIGASPLYVAAVDLLDGLVSTVADADAVATAVGLLIGSEVAADEPSALAVLHDRATTRRTSDAEVARRVIAEHALRLEGGPPADPPID